jgi:two-component system phosphate regulon response regulator PhoB
MGTMLCYHLDGWIKSRNVYVVTVATEQKISAKVLVVDDDQQTRNVVSAGLRREGFLVCEASDVARARKVISKSRPDIVILDLGLPDGDGLELLRSLRTTDNLPVVVCSGRSGEADRLSGLEQGADDYVTKPFSVRELAMRVRVVLRRIQNTPSTPTSLHIGQVVIDVEGREVRRNGAPVQLTAREFELLVFLAKHPKTVFTRGDLLANVWHTASGDRSEATVTEHVRRLRLKLEEDPASPRHLCAVRGVGYRVVP